MKKNLKGVVTISFLILVLLTSGCNLPGANQDISVEDWVATYQQQTADAMGSGDSSGDSGDVTSATATQTIQPTMTLTQTMTLTPTESKPMVSVSVDTNCRTGPGKIYDWIGALLVGGRGGSGRQIFRRSVLGGQESRPGRGMLALGELCLRDGADCRTG